jgi:5-methyltetrahydropteroyltriglutamate--homocysteine methyltransferase
VKRWKNANTDWSHYEATLPLLAKSCIDQVSVETAASGVDVAVIEALRGKDVMLGVVDVGNAAVETPGVIAERLHAAMRYCDPGHLFACTDCGMLPLPRASAEGKLKALAAGAALVNAGLG